MPLKASSLSPVVEPLARVTDLWMDPKSPIRLKSVDALTVSTGYDARIINRALDNAFREITTQRQTGIGAVAGGISEALVTTAIGLAVAIPAVMMFNYLTGRVEAFDVEMDNSSSELIDYFLKRRGAVRR